MKATFKVPKEWHRWTRTMANLPAELAAQSEFWETATEVFFARTQQATHVITGDLRASGDMQVEADNSSITGTVTYGGGNVDYAEYERQRGGTHDFFATSWEASAETFSAMMEQIYEAVWR